mgnify:CR=1
MPCFSVRIADLGTRLNLFEKFSLSAPRRILISSCRDSAGLGVFHLHVNHIYKATSKAKLTGQTENVSLQLAAQ